MKKAAFIIILSILFSCNRGNKTPDYVIPHNDMVNIIIDIHITDGLLTLNNVRRKLARTDSLNYYDAIFSNYGHDRSDFDTSVYFYCNNINKYDKIYGDVLNRLNEMETELKEENSKKILDGNN